MPMEKTIKSKNLLFLWLEWYFFTAVRIIYNNWKEILLFNLYFFSIPFLIKTLFSYWHKYRSYYGSILEPGKFLETFVGNAISRILGAFMRLSLIFIGLFVQIVLFCFFVLSLILWIAVPFVSIILIVMGISLIL